MPGPVSHHTSVVNGDKMYLFGGSSSSGQENKNMYALDLKFMKWEIVHSVSKLLLNLFYILEGLSSISKR